VLERRIAAARLDRAWSFNAALLTIVLAIAFMSHTSTFPLLFCACIFAAALDRWKGQEGSGRAATAVAAATLLALVLAVVLYYAHFGETYRAEFARISAETATAAPDAGGRSLAGRAWSVPRYVGSYLGFAALALAMFGGWDLHRRAARDRLTLATAAWALSCLVFLALGIVTPVDMRYYLASVPAVALAGAAGVSALWRRPGAARCVAMALLVAICWSGVITWYRTF
jgi:hypothetical protein